VDAIREATKAGKYTRNPPVACDVSFDSDRLLVIPVIDTLGYQDKVTVVKFSDKDKASTAILYEWFSSCCL